MAGCEGCIERLWTTTCHNNKTSLGCRLATDCTSGWGTVWGYKTRIKRASFQPRPGIDDGPDDEDTAGNATDGDAHDETADHLQPRYSQP